MRILHIINSMAVSDGGPPSVVAMLVAVQAKLGHDVTVLTLLDDIAINLPGGVAHASEFAEFQLLNLGLPRGWPRFGGEPLRRAQQLIDSADIVHFHGVWEPLLMRSMRYCARSAKPYIVSPHGMLGEFALSQKSVKKRLALALGWRDAVRSATFVHCLTDQESRAVTACGATESIVVIPNGISVHSPADSDIPGIDPQVQSSISHPYILALCRLHWLKGLDLLISAFAEISDVCSELRLVITGPDFGALNDLREQASRSGVESRIDFLGPVYGSEKWRLLQNALCFCQPSRSEGFSMSILEGLASGVPAVVSTACNFPAIQAENAGFVVAIGNIPDLAAALRRCATDAEFRAAAGLRARQLTQRDYSAEAVGRRILDVYAKAVSR